MLTISIEINGETVAMAEAVNASGLADISDYRVRTAEAGNPSLGIETSIKDFIITDHPRPQSVWALVEKIARNSQ